MNETWQHNKLLVRNLGIKGYEEMFIAIYIARHSIDWTTNFRVYDPWISLLIFLQVKMV